MAPDTANAGLHEACARQYLRLYQRTWREGMDDAKLRASRARHALEERGRTFVSDDASNPTGIALGRALPNARVTRRFWRIAGLVARKLSSLAGGPCFAYVRADYYHVTVYNRSHFDHGIVHGLSRAEAELARAALEATQLGTIAIALNGLVLTRDGRLLVRGYPLDDGLARLRCALLDKLPSPPGAQPTLAHVKLGHLLAPLSLAQVRQLCDWLGRVSHQVSAQLAFADVYTPHGRIAL